MTEGHKEVEEKDGTHFMETDWRPTNKHSMYPDVNSVFSIQKHRFESLSF